MRVHYLELVPLQKISNVEESVFVTKSYSRLKELSDKADTSDHSLCVHVETIIVVIGASENSPERFE